MRSNRPSRLAAASTSTSGADAADWPATFDALLRFRRFVRTSFGVGMRAEVKANWLIRGEGPFSRLAVDMRRDLYKMHMRLPSTVDLRAFAVVIRKGVILQKTRNPRELAWQLLLQRLERMSTKSGIPIMLMHDEAESGVIRKVARKARRTGTASSAFGTGWFAAPARLLIDDPVPKRSDQSYFI